MNTNLTQVIVETIEQSKQVLGEGFDFAKKETPLLIQEFLNWKFAEALFIIGFLIVLWIVLVKVAFWVVKRADTKGWCFEDEIKIITAIFCALAAFGMLFGVFIYTKDAIQLKVAPRVYLVEWVASTIKGK